MKIRVIDAGYRGPVEIRIKNLSASPIPPQKLTDTPGVLRVIGSVPNAPGVQSKGEGE